jgi:hypothetical protein
MQKMQKQYFPVRCSQCRILNDAARSSICCHCGNSLAVSSGSGSKSSSVRSYIISALGIIAVAGGLIYLFVNRAPAKSPLQFASTSTESIKLPPDSWHNKSWRSYLTSYPTVLEVLEKNKEVSGKAIPSETIKTTGAIGKIFVTIGACFTQECADAKRESERKRYIYKTPAEAAVKPEAADNYLIYFEPVGAMEIYAKKPDKFLRIFKKPAPYATEDTITGYNGQKGWEKKRFVAANDGKVTETEKDISDLEINELKESMTNAWNMGEYIRPDVEVSAITKVNRKVAFVLSQSGDTSTPKKMYFDAVSGFLIKMDVEGASVYFDDYKDYEGTKMPHTIFYRRPEMEGFYTWVKLEISQWQINKPYEDSMFEK